MYFSQNRISYITILFCVFVNLFSVAQDKRSLDSLINSYNKLLVDSDRFDNLVQQIKVYRLGEPEKAMALSQQLIPLSKKIGTQNYQAKAFLNLAIQYRKQGNYDSSTTLYTQALSIFEKLKDEAQIATCCGSMGIGYWQQKNYEPAIRYFRKSLEITHKLGKRANECSNLNNIGGVFFDMQQYDSSLTYLHASLAISEEMRDTAGLADAYGNMGAVYVLLKDTGNAMKYSQLGANYSKLSGNSYQLFTSYSNIAQVYFMRKQYKESERYGLMSLQIASELGAMEGRKGNYKSLADLYKAMGEPEKANRYLEMYIAVNDSLISEARMKQMTGLEAKYQSVKKDKELLEEKSASEQKTLVLYVLIIGLLLVVALAVFTYRGYRNKQKFLLQMTNAKQEIEMKSVELESRNKDITDSINYASKIQNAVLPNEHTVYSTMVSSFILYKPKDIVSGDFFWFNEIDADTYLFACGDCTGHGIPGALMTVIGSNLLNQIVIDNKIYKPSKILLKMDELLNVTLKQDNYSTTGVQDGMDLALFKVNKSTKEITISTAKRPVVYIRDKKLQEIKGSKFSLGGMRSGDKIFEEVVVNYQINDMFYFFTDGITDQFGGSKGKKFSTKRLKELFLEIHENPIATQKEILNTEVDKWKGSLEQVDDICVVAIRF